MDKARQTEQQIWKGCINKDRKAQEALYHQHAPKMFGVCLGYAKDYDAAKDLLQEGFIKVFQNIHKYDGKGSLEGWIRRVIVNNNIDHYRKNARKNKIIELEETHNSALYNQEEREQNNALKELAKKDFLKLIHSLPDGYRMVLNLYFVEEYTHKEIADKLGITEGTSKSQLSKAKKMVRQKLPHYIAQDEINIYAKG